MMRIIAPWLAKAGEISARTPSLIGAPAGAAAGFAVAGAATGTVVAAGAVVGALATVGLGGAWVGAAGDGLLHAVTTTIMLASNVRATNLIKRPPYPFAAGVGYAGEASQRMTQVGIALDDIVQIEDFSDATMLALAARLERSTAFQELIAREI